MPTGSSRSRVEVGRLVRDLHGLLSSHDQPLALVHSAEPNFTLSGVSRPFLLHAMSFPPGGLPPTGSDYYRIYREKGLTARQTLASASRVMDKIYPEGKNNGFWIGDCRDLAATHRASATPAGPVCFPSSRGSTLLGLHWSPLAGMKKIVEARAGKTEKEGIGAKAKEAEEQVVFSSFCFSKLDGRTICVEPVLPAELPMEAKVQSLEYLFYASHFFDQILMDVHKGRDPESPSALIGLKGPPYDDRVIWAEVDALIWRCCMVFADWFGFKGFYILPTPHHPDLSAERYTFDLNNRMVELDMIPALTPGYVAHTPADEDGVHHYEQLTFCSGCAKKLRGANKKRCSSCGIASYCSRECQKTDWQLFHKAECSKFSTLPCGAKQDCAFCKRAGRKAKA